MPSLEYLRSDDPDAIDPRSDFALGSEFARFLCSDNPSRPKTESLARPGIGDLKQQVLLALLEQRAAQNRPPVSSCLRLVDEDPAQARAAWVAARVAHYRDRRQARHANSRQNLQDQDKTAEQQRRASLCYLDVHRVAQRIVDERKPGVAPRVIRRIVRTMLDLSLVPTHDRIERRRLHARLRRLRKQTGLPLDPTLLR